MESENEWNPYENLDENELMKTHGKKYVQMAEIECSIFRLQAKIEVAKSRGADVDKSGVIKALEKKLAALQGDCAVIWKVLNKLGVTDNWSVPEFTPTLTQQSLF
jgi:hypothetical protein